MNFKEGMRRLALLLGGVGAIVGGLASYTLLQSAIRQRAEHTRFEQLSSLNIVTQTKSEGSDVPTTPDRYTELASRLGGWTAGLGKMTLSEFGEWAKNKFPEYSNLPNVARALRVLHKYPQYQQFIVPAGPSPTGTRSDVLIEGGQTIYPTPAPGKWSYVVIAILPLLGFLIPWAAVRAIGWVGAGFCADPK